jgi:hypothetical protein
MVQEGSKHMQIFLRSLPPQNNKGNGKVNSIEHTPFICFDRAGSRRTKIVWNRGNPRWLHSSFDDVLQCMQYFRIRRPGRRGTRSTPRMCKTLQETVSVNRGGCTIGDLPTEPKPWQSLAWLFSISLMG